MSTRRRTRACPNKRVVVAPGEVSAARADDGKHARLVLVPLGLFPAACELRTVELQSSNTRQASPVAHTAPSLREHFAVARPSSPPTNMAALPLSASPERVQSLEQSPGVSATPSPADQAQLPPLPPAFASSAPVSRVSSASPPLAASAPYATVTSTTFGTLDNPLIPKKRRRTTPAELAILEHEFRVNARPDPLERARIAERLGMTARAVQVWYQNRRCVGATVCFLPRVAPPS